MTREQPFNDPTGGFWIRKYAEEAESRPVPAWAHSAPPTDTLDKALDDFINHPPAPIMKDAK